MPITDSDGRIVGVVSLMNKKNNTCFTDNDESFVEAFGIFCGISLANVTNFEVVKEAEARSQVFFGKIHSQFYFSVKTGGFGNHDLSRKQQ